MSVVDYLNKLFSKKPPESSMASGDLSLAMPEASVTQAMDEPMSRAAASMDAQGAWNPQDSTGFIRINAVRLKAHARP